MRLILSDILSLSHHIKTLEQTPELYRPCSCQHCHETVIWRHGYYYRMSDRLNSGKDSLNDIPIPRFQCAVCRHTFSTLPECIAPSRWYPWLIQQWCLWLTLNGWSVKQLHQVFPMARSTISRWVNWLADSFTKHHQVLCTQISEMGYFSDFQPFWCHWLDLKHFSVAMTLINKNGLPVP
jgi:transposase-like protein